MVQYIFNNIENSMTKERYIILFILIIFTSCKNNEKSEVDLKDKIHSAFIRWSNIQIQNGKYLDKNKCNIDYCNLNHNLTTINGIPEDIKTYYADINKDGIIDGIIIFNPIQCDGGNGVMYSEEKVLILSDNGRYIPDDSFINKVEEKYGDGWIYVKDVRNDTIFVTSLSFSKNNNSRHPDIEKEGIIKYPNHELFIISTNVTSPIVYDSESNEVGTCDVDEHYSDYEIIDCKNYIAYVDNSKTTYLIILTQNSKLYHGLAFKIWNTSKGYYIIPIDPNTKMNKPYTSFYDAVFYGLTYQEETFVVWNEFSTIYQDATNFKIGDPLKHKFGDTWTYACGSDIILKPVTKYDNKTIKRNVSKALDMAYEDLKNKKNK